MRVTNRHKLVIRKEAGLSAFLTLIFRYLSNSLYIIIPVFCLTFFFFPKYRTCFWWSNCVRVIMSFPRCLFPLPGQKCHVSHVPMFPLWAQCPTQSSNLKRKLGSTNTGMRGQTCSSCQELIWFWCFVWVTFFSCITISLINSNSCKIGEGKRWWLGCGRWGRREGGREGREVEYTLV